MDAVKKFTKVMTKLIKSAHSYRWKKKENSYIGNPFISRPPTPLSTWLHSLVNQTIPLLSVLHHQPSTLEEGPKSEGILWVQYLQEYAGDKCIISS